MHLSRTFALLFIMTDAAACRSSASRTDGSGGAGTRPAAAADSILARSRAAMRGTSTHDVRTRIMEGTYEYTGQGGQHAVVPLYMHWRAPGVLYEEMKAPFGLMRRWSDGDRGWASRPEFPNRPLPDAEISEVRRDAALFQPADLAKEYKSYVFEGRQTLNARDVDVIAATSRSGRIERFFFDASSGLPVQLDVWEEGPEGLRGNGTEFYLAHYKLSDYRDADGFMLPFYIARIRPNSSVLMRFTSIRHNVPVDTTREAPPTEAPGTVRSP